jgi:hypothetical protein
MVKTISVPWLFLCAVVLGLTAGCAAAIPQFPASPATLTEAIAPQGSGWWFVRFRM